ncbi:unnamed protein product [Alopecurus aequalis]
MVKKKPTNSNAKGKGAASSSAPPPPKPAPGSARPKKVFKKRKAKADPEKQKAAAAVVAAIAGASVSAPTPVPAPAEVSPSTALVVAENSGADTKMVAENNGDGSKTAAENNGDGSKMVAGNNGDGSKMVTGNNGGDRKKVTGNNRGDRKIVTGNSSADRKMGRKERMKGRPNGEGQGRMKGKEKKDGEVGEEKDEQVGAERGVAGFIFMCNAKTKPECFQNSVFGLPKGKIDVVEKIRTGAKLFLYDFDLKLLYGVYKATARGGMDLVRRAFNGRFPAQVKFKIDKDCLPIPESSFKHAIKENYDSKGKFTQELNSRQVRKLLALYKPISLHRSSLQHEEIRPARRGEGRMPHYVEERRQQYDYEERRLSRHDEEMQRPRFVEERRLDYGYEERRPSHHVDEIQRPRFVEEVRAPAYLPESQYAPPSYYRHVAPASNDLYHPHQAIIYERAPGEAANRDPYLARDYRVLPAELDARSNHVDDLYRSYKLVTRPEGLRQDPAYAPSGYENHRSPYPENIQRPVSTRVPVSSLYSFAGAPAYR